MSGAREEILARLRVSAAGAQLPRVEAPPTPARPPADVGELARRFAEEATAVGCAVHGPAAPSDAVDALVALLRELHAHALLAWDAAELPVPGLAEALPDRGFRFADPVLPVEREGRAARLARLDQADVGLTGALAGLADTGSLVLASGPQRPRLSWLLPPVHVALLKLADLHASLDAFLASRGGAAAGSANLVAVTGPSRTGDIEQVLTRGVHGPGALHVLLLA